MLEHLLGRGTDPQEGSPASVAENLPSLYYLLLRNFIFLPTHFPTAKTSTWKSDVIHFIVKTKYYKSFKRYLKK
jgi:hypothetical protein